MSFGGTGGFGGFGQSNNQTSGFGGFGANNNTSGFGNNTTAAGGFGANNNTTASSGSGGMFGGGGFGANTSTGGFGANTTNNNAFGAAKPTAFGGGTTATGGGLFGSNNQASSSTGTTGFGGFGAAATTNNSSGFGGSGGLFGNKTFGQSNTTPASTSLFGGGNNTTATTGFGGGFGAANNPGLGGNIGEPPGTNATPFQAHSEKEVGGTGNLTNSFQNILFQDAYKKWSAEELRLTDYNQGRRYGNASGTGAFGVSSFGNTGFNSGAQQSSGFGGNNANTTGGLFGGTATNNSTAFGGGTTTGGFGATNSGGGGLFGSQPKPATGGLFGNSTTTAQPAQSGGLFGGSSTGTGFGNATATTGGFGSNAGSGGGLFGGAQNKTGGFSFGTNTSSPATGFGAANTGTGFGANSGNAAPAGGGGLFGNTGQATTGGLFGGTGQQQQNSQQGTTQGGFGSTTFGTQSQPAGSSLFGGAQQKPAGGLFGNTSSGTLFGNANAGTGTSTTFGGATNNNAASGGGGLFGQKPATGGTGLFGTGGATTQNNNSGTGGTGLFGGLGAGTQNTQGAQGGLFQSTGQSQAKPGLFGTSQPSGGGLFGSQPAQQSGSLFGSMPSQQQAQNPTLGGSLLGSSQMAGNSQQSLTASINDLSAYGNPSLFSNIGGNDVPNPGPLATPLSSKTKSRRGSILPMYKLNPASASRFVTPQKRGFGFSYSTYGTPGTPSSTASTPGSMGRSMLGTSLNRGLSKSVSSSSLRKSFSAEDSILAPGAFSTSSGSRYYGNTGSVRKLVINKEMRSDLFSTPTKERPSIEPASAARKLSKRVSFDTSTVESAPVAAPSHASIATEDSLTDPQEAGSNNAKQLANGSSDPTTAATGQELAIVHEEDAAQTPRASEAMDKAPGEYWMSPTQNAISAMNRIQRQSVENFTVGRDNVGYVRFRVPVDLTSIDLDDIFGVIVVLETRSATVYPNTAKKPPVGKGLNVPAAICLEQSWPRGRDKRPTGDSRRLGKHIERLKRIPDTTFIDYSQDSGIWKFTVEHFTTYGLDYDDEDEVEVPSSAPVETGSPSLAISQPHLHEKDSVEQQDENDTFEFRRKRRALPGAFDAGDADSRLFHGETSFFESRFAGPSSNSLILSSDGDTSVGDAGPDLSDAPRVPSGQVEEKQATAATAETPESPVTETPGGILRARMRAMKGSATPIRIQVADGDDWMDMLQKSVSPQKRDRVLLKSTLDMPSLEDNSPRGATTTSHPPEPRGFATSIDLMHSLFEKKRVPSTRLSGGFVQWPYDRQEKSFGKPSLDGEDSAFRNSPKPTWGPDGTLVLPVAQAITSGPGLVQPKPSILLPRSSGSGSETGVTFLRFSNESAASAIKNHMRLTHVHSHNGIPTAELQFQQLADLFHSHDLGNPANAQEKLVWDLASILFDAPEPTSSDHEEVSRRRELSRFWTAMVDAGTSRSVALAKSYEGKALSSLSGNRIHEACKFLVEGRDFRLATLVSLIGASEASRSDIGVQLAQWNENDVLSDFSDAIRALYAILAGNVCVCQGKKGVPIADRMESFVISRRFGFDWKQAFGLRLWYAAPESHSLSGVISSFDDDIKQDLEDAPRAWYLEQGIDALWQDPAQNLRHDLLWGLLRLYARIEDDLESVLRPENSQLSPLDSRLCWQLGRALSATGKCSFGEDANVKADAATISFADQLVNEGSWLEATFVLLHLTSPSTRAKAIKEHLCRHAGDLGPESGVNFNTLTQAWKIPAEWLWEAKALYMRSAARNPTAEVHCLLRANSFAAAHETLVSKVAPAAIISRDYAALSSLLAHFEGHEGYIPGWQVGGEIFRSFLILYKHQEHQEHVPEATLNTLLAGLPAMQDAVRGADMASIAAVCEMSNIVAKTIAASQKGQRASPILELPLAESAHLKHSVHLGLSHYQGIMAGSR